MNQSTHPPDRLTPLVQDCGHATIDDLESLAIRVHDRGFLRGPESRVDGQGYACERGKQQGSESVMCIRLMQARLT